jgi:hypothetical protein
MSVISVNSLKSRRERRATGSPLRHLFRCGLPRSIVLRTRDENGRPDTGSEQKLQM